MIKINFKSNVSRAFAHYSMGMVSEDVYHFVRLINRKKNTDMDLPCPEPNKYYMNNNRTTTGIANNTCIWFGNPGEQPMDISVFSNSKFDLVTNDEWLNLMFKLTALSICEQFPGSKFETDEDFSAAIELYEQELGCVSDSAMRCIR